jgi:hypothetical protein
MVRSFRSGAGFSSEKLVPEAAVNGRHEKAVGDSLLLSTLGKVR